MTVNRIPDIYVPFCPACGDPVTSGCYPAQGICAITDDDAAAPIEAPGNSALTDEEWAALYPGQQLVHDAREDAR